jgi:hypothetical protein
MKGSLSVKRMMAIVLVSGAGMAALADPTPVWTDVFLFVTTVVLLTAALGALFHRGPRRIAWTGFSLFGWFYFLLDFAPLFASRTGLLIPTNRLYQWAFEKLHPLHELVAQARSRPGVRNIYRETAENFYQSAHLESTLLFALLGAFLASAVTRPGRSEGPADLAR